MIALSSKISFLCNLLLQSNRYSLYVWSSSLKEEERSSCSGPIGILLADLGHASVSIAAI